MKIIKNRTICYVAGASGGHIIPSLTEAKKMREDGKFDHIIFFTSNALLDKKIIEKSNIIDFHIAIKIKSFPGKRIWNYPLFCVTFLVAFLKSLRYLIKFKPKCVVSMGGLISIPVCLAAYCMRIPFDIYELNVEPGKANNLLSRYARTIFICFEQTRKFFHEQNCKLTSYPIRYNEKNKILSSQAIKQLSQACEDFSSKRKTIFVLGGSQGSQFLNNLLKRLIEFDPEIAKKVQLIHQTGAYDAFDWKLFYETHKIPAIIFDFNHDLAPYYCAADLVICRSGAGSLAETIFFQKKCITIPLETSSTAHQKLNATAYAKEYPKLVKIIFQHELQNSILPLHELMNKIL